MRICFGFRYLNFEFAKKQTTVFVIHYQVTLFGCGCAALRCVIEFDILSYFVEVS